MKKLLLLLGVFILTMGLATTSVVAQDNLGTDVVGYALPEIAVLDVAGTATTLTLVAPNAGESVANTSVSAEGTSSLNYTSVVGSAKTNKITAAITVGSVPTSTLLQVKAFNYAGTGDGTFGTAADWVTLSGTAADLITGIESCYTEVGADKGRRLDYFWGIPTDQYTTLLATSGSVTVTYTIVAE